ncbi:MAG TPA: CHAT domain-containing protein, partial [Ardenticatenaceae bacterium]|nr:CHAT domain-containing protein [Ardenticatenaceae bacterium]
MDREVLAARLASADPNEQAALLAEHAALADVQLAEALRGLVYAAWTSEPTRVAGAAGALGTLARTSGIPQVVALAAWAAGIEHLAVGRMEAGIAALEQAEARWLDLGQEVEAARTQVSKLYALAVLGRYDEAIACGLAARAVFVAHGDLLAAGKIEQNLGNLSHRRDRYSEAEQFYRAARERFAVLGELRQLTQVENGLANVLTALHHFDDAAALYEQALERAEAAELAVTQAEIECNLGYLELVRGHYDRALEYLEQSRRRYAELGLAHETAVAELELADAYLELNLAPEAAAIYDRVAPTFASLGMRAEEAHAQLNHARARLGLAEISLARLHLETAGGLYAAEGNQVGEGMVTLTQAQADLLEGTYAAAQQAAREAEARLAPSGAWGRFLLARWIGGEAARLQDRHEEARADLEATLLDAEKHSVPQIVHRCHTSLGLLAAAEGDTRQAETSFKQAIALIEEMRAPLPAEEFRVAFVADKLVPYGEMVRLCLAEAGASRVEEALSYVERARSRALLDMMGGIIRTRSNAQDPFETGLLARLEELRAELNLLYSQMDRQSDHGSGRNVVTMGPLHEAVREREAALLGLERQLQQRGASAYGRVEPVDIALLQRDLGPETVLVEYFELDGELVAFVVDEVGVAVVREVARQEQVEAALAQFRFQVGALRYGTARLRPHLQQLTVRAQHYLGILYDLLLRPLEAHVGGRRLVVVPHGALHYVPFHALYDGERYVVEQREVCVAPSAAVLHRCLATERAPLRRAVLLGVPDQHTPRVRDEVLALAALFPDAIALLDEQATMDAFYRHAPEADVLHLACHGHFRPDNPLFSALRLSDGWLTVRDTYRVELRCQLAA